MMKRIDFEKRENENLASFGFKSSGSSGRRHREPEHEYRTCFQRDRDRVIYSTAFRRLEYKTQVFVNHEGDHYRTRLTHTLEVAQIARTIARALKLNDDLAESIALAHDLGHTPFGHSGESVLNKLMKDHDGFEHNRHGLRVVDILEEKYPDFPGLNLTGEVREGIIRHSSFFDKPKNSKKTKSLRPLIEVQVVDLADEIAYDNHDLDDGLASDMINESELLSVPMWKEFELQVRKSYPGVSGKMKRIQIIKRLIDHQVTDVINFTTRSIAGLRIKTPDDVRHAPVKVVSFSDEMNEKRKPLRRFLMENLYRHYRVVRMSDKAGRILSELFLAYIEKPDQLPTQTAARLKSEGVHRVVCDYLAGMTDRYALNEYKKFFDPDVKV